ncbi:MAG: MATE family efflux transporter [Candidatus Limiplasma sp.]|nr:MATE family efflux transporter [Candidatus Limiplasma sp.]
MVRDLTVGPPLRRVMSFCLPILVGSLFQQAYAIVESILVGKYLGVEAFAAVGSTGPMNTLILGFGLGFASGLCIPIAQHFGAGDVRALRRAEANGLYLLALICALMALFMTFLTRPILVLFNTPANLLEDAVTFIGLTFKGSFAMLFYSLFLGYMRALGDSKTPLLFLILACILNILLDLLFIGMLHTGVEGAAWATILSQLIAALFCVRTIRKHVPILYLTKEDAKPSLKEMLSLCRTSIPLGLLFSLVAIGSVVIQSAVNSLGSDAVAALSANGKVQNALLAPLDAAGVGLATFVSQNYGARRFDRIRQGIRQSTLLFFGYCAFAFAINFFFGCAISELFVDRSQTAIHGLVRQLLMTNSYFFVFITLIYIYRYAMQGLGFSNVVMASGLLETAGRMIAGLLLLAPLGFTAICLASPIAWTLSAVFLFPMYIHAIRKLERASALS